MTSRLLEAFKQEIKSLALIPSGGGCFELTVDGEVIYSKLKSGKFPDEQAMIEAVSARAR